MLTTTSLPGCVQDDDHSSRAIWLKSQIPLNNDFLPKMDEMVAKGRFGKTEEEVIWATHGIPREVTVVP